MSEPNLSRLDDARSVDRAVRALVAAELGDTLVLSCYLDAREGRAACAAFLARSTARVRATLAGAAQGIPDMHDSRNALDWPGVYKGVLPCADCEGIETRLSLQRDGDFERTTRYLGKADRVFTARGRTDNYTLTDGVLSLNKARMAPLARFEVRQAE
jgi:uncharacterized lipoprotein NlpE involved in copper resistance